MLDIRLLLQFAAVAESLSFTAAARQLGIGQPRLSAQIRKLESQLGVTLFERSTRLVELTPQGADLKRVVEPLAAAAREALTQIGEIRAQARAIVRLGCPQLGAPDPHQAQLVSGFARHHPDLTVEIQVGQSSNVTEQLRKGKLDLALMSMLPKGDEWEAIPLYRLAFVAIMHEGDPLASADTPLQPSLFSGRCVAAFYRRQAPELHDRLYGEMIAAGARLMEVPELRRSLLRGRPELIVSTIVVAPADTQLRHNLVRREIAAPDALWMSLVRLRTNLATTAAERFWRWAKRQSDLKRIG